MSMRPPASPVAEHALLRPVKSGNTFEETVERLAQAIKLGVVAHGERLPAERELAERLNVARVTLREAIKALQQAGFVESRRGRSGGTFVTYVAGRSRRSPRAVARTMGRDELLDALVFRSVVEPAAAELAASRVLTDADRASLTGHLAEVASASPSGRRLADSRLHLAIAELSGSSSLAAAVAQVQGR
ncbi:MAG TPA: GntR family transcriptional regulator, partial [Acidimicrobiales bacterium]